MGTTPMRYVLRGDPEIWFLRDKAAGVTVYHSLGSDGLWMDPATGPGPKLLFAVHMSPHGGIPPHFRFAGFNDWYIRNVLAPHMAPAGGCWKKRRQAP